MTFMSIAFSDLAQYAAAAAQDGVSLKQTRAATRWIGAHKEGTLIGFLGIMDLAGGGVRIKGVYVLPSNRGMGVGTGLVDEAISIAERQGCPCIEAIAYNIGFYEGKGFKKVGSARPNGAQLLRRVL